MLAHKSHTVAKSGEAHFCFLFPLFFLGGGGHEGAHKGRGARWLMMLRNVSTLNLKKSILQFFFPCMLEHLIPE